MTITTITTGNLGTTTSLANQSITKTTLQTGTTGVILNVKVTLGAESPNQSDEIEVRYVILPESLTADATLIPVVEQFAGSLRIKTSQRGAGITRAATGLIANNGGYLYTWYNSPALSPSGAGSAGTVVIQSVELP